MFLFEMSKQLGKEENNSKLNVHLSVKALRCGALTQQGNNLSIPQSGRKEHPLLHDCGEKQRRKSLKNVGHKKTERVIKAFLSGNN